MPKRRKQTADAVIIAEGAKQDLMAVLREKQVFSLRMAGKTFGAIASACGYSNASAAAKAYKRALEKVVATTDTRTERLTMALQLDELYAAVHAQAVGDGNTKQSNFAVDRALAIMDRRARLLGLDTPTKTDGVTQTAQIVTVAYPGEWLAALHGAQSVVEASHTAQVSPNA